MASNDSSSDEIIEKIRGFTKNLLNKKHSSLSPRQARSLMGRVRGFDQSVHIMKSSLKIVEKSFDIELLVLMSKIPDQSSPNGLSEDKGENMEIKGLDNPNNTSTAPSPDESLCESEKLRNNLPHENIRESAFSADLPPKNEKVNLESINELLTSFRDSIRILYHVFEPCYIYDEKGNIFSQKLAYNLCDIIPQFFTRYVGSRLCQHSKYIVSLVTSYIQSNIRDGLTLKKLIQTLKIHKVYDKFEGEFLNILFQNHKISISKRFNPNSSDHELLLLVQSKVSIYDLEKLRIIRDFFSAPEQRVYYEELFPHAKKVLLNEILDFESTDPRNRRLTYAETNHILHFALICERNEFLAALMKKFTIEFMTEYFVSGSWMISQTAFTFIFTFYKHVEILADFRKDISRLLNQLLTEIICSYEQTVFNFLNTYIHERIILLSQDCLANFHDCVSCYEYNQIFAPKGLVGTEHAPESSEKTEGGTIGDSRSNKNTCLAFYESFFSNNACGGKEVPESDSLKKLNSNDKELLSDYLLTVEASLLGVKTEDLDFAVNSFTADRVHLLLTFPSLFQKTNTRFLEQNLGDFAAFLDLSYHTGSICFLDMIATIKILSNQEIFYKEFSERVASRLLSLGSIPEHEFNYVRQINRFISNKYLTKIRMMIIDILNEQYHKNQRFLSLNKYRWPTFRNIRIKIPKNIGVTPMSLPRKQLSAGYNKILEWNWAVSTCLIHFNDHETRVNVLQYIILNELLKKSCTISDLSGFCDDTEFVDSSIQPLMKNGLVILTEQQLSISSHSSSIPKSLVPNIPLEVLEKPEYRPIESSTNNHCDSAVDCHVMSYLKKNKSINFLTLHKNLKSEFPNLTRKTLQERITYLVDLDFLSQEGNSLHYIP